MEFVIISGLIMCVTPIADITIKSISEEDYANPLKIWIDISPMDIENDVVRSIRSFSLNNCIDNNHMQDLIPSSWGEYHSREINLLSSSSPYQATYIIHKPQIWRSYVMKVEAVVPRRFVSQVDLSEVYLIPAQMHLRLLRG